MAPSWDVPPSQRYTVCVCVCVMRYWHASGRRLLPLQVTPLTSHLFPVEEEKEGGARRKMERPRGMCAAYFIQNTK